MMYTEGDRPRGLEDEASRCATEANDKIKVEGTDRNSGSRGDENRQGKSAAEC